MKQYILLAIFVFLVIGIVELNAVNAIEIGHGFQNVTDPFTTNSFGSSNVTNAYLESGNFTAGEDYLIFVTAQWKGSDISDRYDMHLTHGGAGAVFDGARQEIEPASNSIWYTYSFFTLWQPTGSEGSENIQLQMSTIDSTNWTADMITMVSLKVSDLASTDFFYNQDTTSFDLSTIGVGAWSTANNATITFTPSNDNDVWLIGTSSRADIVDLSDLFVSGISVNGTDPINSGGMVIMDEGEDNAENVVMTVYKTFTLHNTEQTFREEFSNQVDDIGIRQNSQVFALRLNAFESFSEDFIDTQIAISSGETWTQNPISDTITTSTAGDVFVLAQLITDDTGTNPAHMKLTVNDSDAPIKQESNDYHMNFPQDAGEELAWHIMNMSSLSVSTHDLDIRTGGGDGGPAGMEDRMIVAFSMELASATPEYVVDLLDLYESESTTIGSGIPLCQNIDLETSATECTSELEVGHTIRFEVTVRNDGTVNGSPTSMDIDSAVTNFGLLGTIPASQILDSGCSTNTDWTESIVSTDVRVSSGTTCSITSSGGTAVFWAVVRILSDAGGGANPTVTFTIRDATTSDTSTTTTFNVNNIIGGSYG